MILKLQTKPETVVIIEDESPDYSTIKKTALGFILEKRNLLTDNILSSEELSDLPEFLPDHLKSQVRNYLSGVVKIPANNEY